MRINARIATSSSRGVSRFPTIPDDECVDADGNLDEVRARQILNSEDLITWADDDDKSVMAFAMEFLRQLKNVVVWMNRQPDIDVKYDRAETKIEKRCARNLERGRYCFSRVEIKHRRDRIEASVSWSNPMGIVGEGADKIPKDFALLCVNVLLCIGDEIKKRGGIEIAVIEGDNCAGYIAEAREINHQRDLELKMIKLVEKKGCVQKPRRRLLLSFVPRLRVVQTGWYVQERGGDEVLLALGVVVGVVVILCVAVYELFYGKDSEG